MRNFFSNLVDRIFIVFGAILFMQFPLFMHHYQQQLIGRVAELQWQMDEMQKAAMESEKTVDNYIDKFTTHTDFEIARQGKTMRTTERRWKNFSEALHAIQNTTILSKPWIFIYHFNFTVGYSALQTFQMGLTFNWEALVYGLVGIYVGYFAFLGGKKLLKSYIGKKFSERKI